MTDYPYDPELPFVVARIKENEPGYPVGIIARFKDKHYALDMAEGFVEGWVEMVDTTPAPKIPADAEFIYYSLRGLNLEPTPYYAKRHGHPGNHVWELDTARRITEDELLEEIQDAEVVVLKRA